MSAAGKGSPRPKVLVLIEADGFVRAFAEKHVDAHVAVVPECAGHEALAEDVAHLMLPMRFRPLLADDKLRATGIYRKLKPSALLAARETAIAVERLNRLTPKRGQR